MAEFKPKSKQGEAKGQSIFELWEQAESKPTPNTFKIGREATFQLAKAERDLFTDWEEGESGNYIVSGLSKKVTDTDFYAFSFGVGQILSNQSKQTGNETTHSGLTQTIARNLGKQTGNRHYSGEIVTTLNDLCKASYGEQTTAKKKAMAALIDTLHSTPVTITFKNGDKFEAALCVKMGKYTRQRDGAVYYHLILNPIFCENVKRNFAEFPQNYTSLLASANKKSTAAHLKLSLLLGAQDKRKPYTIYIDILLEKLGLAEAHRINRDRTEKQLLNLFEDMKKVGLILSYQTETTTIRRKKRIVKITFNLNPNFARKEKPDEQK